MGLVNSSSGEIVTIKSSGDYPEASGPWATVTQRFDDTLQRADEMLALLIGSGGDGGYLGDLRSVIENAPNISITPPSINTSITLRHSTTPVPLFNEGDLAEYPTDSYPAPVLQDLPTIDASGLSSIPTIAPIDATLTWNGTPLSTDIYPEILGRIIALLTSGATGLSPAVEQAIYDRARERQRADRLEEYNKINNSAAELQFQFPSGVLLSGLVDFGIGATRQDADIENQIIVTQAELEQKNSQFALQQAVELEKMIRASWSDAEARNLKFAESKVDFLIRDFAERSRAIMIGVEAQKAYIEGQVSNLRGVVDSNKGKIEIFKEQYEALETRINAISARNKSVTDVFTSRMSGYTEEQRAIASENASAIEALKAEVSAAEIEVRAAIAEAEQAVQGYSSEMSLRERVTTAMASIAAQSVASWAGAVNASASLGYNGSESKSESWSHSDNLSESHSWEHDPGA